MMLFGLSDDPCTTNPQDPVCQEIWGPSGRPPPGFNPTGLPPNIAASAAGGGSEAATASTGEIEMPADFVGKTTSKLWPGIIVVGAILAVGFGMHKLFHGARK